MQDQARDTASALMRLRSMTIEGIFESTFSLYAKNAGLFIATGAVILMPYIVLIVFIAAIVVSSDQVIIDKLALLLIQWGLLTIDPVSLYYDLAAVGLALAILIFFVVIEPLAAAAITVAVARRFVNRPTTIGLVYRSILPRTGPLVLTMVWASLRLVPLIIACAGLVGIPLVCYFLVAWFFIVPILVLEKSHGSPSKRSRALVKGEWWNTCGFVVANALLFIATIIVVAVIGVIIRAIPGFTDPQPQAQVLVIAAVFVVALALPVHVGATTLYFYGLTLREHSGNLPEHLITLA